MDPFELYFSNLPFMDILRKMYGKYDKNIFSLMIKGIKSSAEIDCSYLFKYMVFLGIKSGFRIKIFFFWVNTKTWTYAGDLGECFFLF